jgi:transposase-like protein
MRMKRECWLAHVAAIRQEGISTAAYAKRHGLAAKSLYNWQRKLRIATPATSRASNGSTFIALRVAEPVVAPQPHAMCTLMLAPGLRLEMAALPATQWLAALARALQGAH